MRVALLMLGHPAASLAQAAWELALDRCRLIDTPSLGMNKSSKSCDSRWRPSLIRMSMVVVTAACGAPARPVTAVPDVVTADAGAATFESEPGELGHWSWDEYVRETSPYKSLARLTRPHPGASSTARYGINLHSGGENASWVVDGDRARGYWLVVDANLDGDLANDQRWNLQTAQNDWRVEVTTRPRIAGGPATRFVVAFDGTDVRVYPDAVRTGVIVIEGHALKFAISCLDADCGETEAVRVGFDLDGDGAVDLASPGSYERYTLRDRRMVAFGRSYDFEIAPSGGRVTLRRARTEYAPRPTLARGSMAPTFEAADDHARFSLASARGQVVLVDFFSVGCHFCVEDLPWLVRVHDRYAGAGLRLVTLAAGTAPSVEHDWPTIVETDPRQVAALYRVEAYPAYFVVDRDGKIACARCLHDDAERVLAALFAHPPAGAEIR